MFQVSCPLVGAAPPPGWLFQVATTGRSLAARPLVSENVSCQPRRIEPRCANGICLRSRRSNKRVRCWDGSCCCRAPGCRGWWNNRRDLGQTILGTAE